MIGITEHGLTETLIEVAALLKTHCAALDHSCSLTLQDSPVLMGRNKPTVVYNQTLSESTVKQGLLTPGWHKTPTNRRTSLVKALGASVPCHMWVSHNHLCSSTAPRCHGAIPETLSECCALQYIENANILQPWQRTSAVQEHMKPA